MKDLVWEEEKEDVAKIVGLGNAQEKDAKDFWKKDKKNDMVE